MTKYRLTAGVDIDLPDAAERERHHRQMMRALVSMQPLTIQHSPVIPAVDANGNLGGGAGGVGVPIYRVPEGRSAAIHRLSIAGYVPGGTVYTPAAPLLSAGVAWITMHAAGPASPGGQIMLLPASGTLILPQVITDGSDAMVLRNGEVLTWVGAGLPVGLQMFARIQLDLFPTPVAAEAVVAPPDGD